MDIRCRVNKIYLYRTLKYFKLLNKSRFNILIFIDLYIRRLSALGYIFDIGILHSIGYNVFLIIYLIIDPVLTIFKIGVNLRPNTNTLTNFYEYY